MGSRKNLMGNRRPPWPQCNRLSVEVTTRCNLSCSHCFVRARRLNRSSLPSDLVRTILLEGYETGYRILHITGGEPLLWNGLLDILEYAFALGYKTVLLNTNGTLLSRELSRKLSDYNGLHLSLSLQGSKRRHDLIRGEGSYDRARKGLENALNAGLPTRIFTTVGRSLIPDLPGFAGKVFGTYPGIERLTWIQLIRVPDDVFDLSKEVLGPDDFLRLVRMISLLNLCGLKVDLLNNPLAVVASRVLKIPRVPLSPGLYRSGSIMITAQVRLTAAHSTREDFGMYEPGFLRTICRSEKYRRLVGQDRTICQKCAYRKLCRMGGMVRPSEWYRDMFPQVPYCQRVLAKASSYG